VENVTHIPVNGDVVEFGYVGNKAGCRAQDAIKANQDGQLVGQHSSADFQKLTTQQKIIRKCCINIASNNKKLERKQQ
jgi:hypothetical protein